ncbi:MAG: FAD-dependent oxidoreductase [Syntrophobacterales bacterium]|nr:MAG: FAD-dependent oxidoreductase [Syntrophobacterales bacterium]
MKRKTEELPPMVAARTHRPTINPLRCGQCFVCQQGCPGEFLREYRQEGGSLRGEIYRNREPGSVPATGECLPPAPCQQACPLGQDVRGYIERIAAGKPDQALAIVRESNPLPSVCGFICSRPCEEVCLREWIDDPLSIRALKRYVVEYPSVKQPAPSSSPPRRGKPISIIGSGPAGLAAAHDLARMGHGVRILEAHSKPGGMLTMGIPPFRLPQRAVEEDIAHIEAMGVEIGTNCCVGKGDSLKTILGDSAALILAVGAQRSLTLGIVGEDELEGYFDCLSLLREFSLGHSLDLGERVIVVGGGYAALDAARTALRTGSAKVTVIYRRALEDMPAGRGEVEEALDEGVEIHAQSLPTAILNHRARVKGLRCVRTKMGRRDKGGRRSFMVIEGAEFEVEADSIIAAVGQEPDLSWLPDDYPLGRARGNALLVNEELATTLAGVFAAGDVVTGPSSVVEAMASGKKAAQSVHRFLIAKGGRR